MTLDNAIARGTTFAELMDFCGAHFFETGNNSICTADNCECYEICRALDKYFFGRVPAIGLKPGQGISPDDEITNYVEEN